MRTFIPFIAAALELCLCGSCTKNNQNGNGQDTIPEELLPMTMEMNALSGGLVASDAECDYFQWLDGDKVTLRKVNRESGDVAILAERPWVESSNADVLFTDLSLRDGYLYFTLFDANASISYAWCRVPVDGSGEYETICELGWDYEGFHFDSRKVYMETEDKDTEEALLAEFDFETGTFGSGYPLAEGLKPIFIYEGYIYGKDYTTTDGVFHMQLYRQRIGTKESELVWSDPAQQSFLCMAYGSKLYVSDSKGKKFYEADLDGKNAKVLFEGFEILKLNVHNGVIYLQAVADSAAGIYAYSPGSTAPVPLFLCDDIVFGPIITGTGNIWFTRKMEDSSFRLGQLHVLPICGNRQ